MKIPNIEVELKFSPELIIYIGEKEIGRIIFNNLKGMGIFIDNLKKFIEDEIKKEIKE